VKLRGYRIELGEIEAVLESHVGVRQAVVTVREESAGDQRLVGYVVGESWSSEREAAAELRGYLKERLPEYMAPQQWVLLEQMPLTANGKVDRKSLPAPTATSAFEQAEEGEWTPVEELVAGIWSEVLKLAAVGRDENFFELGGHSLLATQVISRVREVFGVEVGLRQLFEAPTVRGLSCRIEEELRAGEGVTAPPLARAEREQWGGLLPLSFAQQRLWFLDQLEPGNTSYNIPVAVRLKGELDVASLERTLSEIVRRHEVLRTRFVNGANEPRQEILAPASMTVTLTDFSALNELAREAAVREAVRAESQLPFDLANGPLLRVKLLRLNEAEHVALLVMHHIVSDGWSMDVLIREVRLLYAAYSKGEESPLPELPIQYSDFAIWQRSCLHGEALERQLTYWRKQLGGDLSVLALPTDHPRELVPSNRGSRLEFLLSPEVSNELKQLSRREGATLFMTMLAAFQTLLYRYSGQEEIVVGTDVANRNRAETEPLIGFFVNQLVLRTDLSGEPTFVELLRRVKEVCLGAYAHQDVPFEKLVEELQPERDPSRSPLFQVVFLLDNAGDRSRLPHSRTDVQPTDTTVRFDLTLSITNYQNALAGTWFYRTSLFNTATIARFRDNFEVLLQSIAANPSGRLSTFKILTPEEKERAHLKKQARNSLNLERLRTLKRVVPVESSSH
jgi:acyl carrier protein